MAEGTPIGPGPVILDITRLLSRTGRTSTGVDRVERAYLRRLLSEDREVMALARTRLGLILLDRAGTERFAARLGSAPGPPDLMARLPGGPGGPHARAEADLRRAAVVHALRGRLSPGIGLRRLSRAIPAGATYLNTGHADLEDDTFRAMRRAGARIAVLLHDAIPLDHPEHQRPGTPAAFADRLTRVGRQADLVVHNSAHTRARTEHHMQRLADRVPPGIVAHLGVERLAVGARPDVPDPYFVILGTVEPRKNHALLLEIWEKLSPKPTLVIAGPRGWANEAVFARLDARPKGIIEMTRLDDAAIGGLIAGACGLLMPSHAEGYGLPAMEAAAIGARVLCNDLPALREVLGPRAVYADVADRYAWRRRIETWAAEPAALDPWAAPTWDAHFNLVLGKMA